MWTRLVALFCAGLCFLSHSTAIDAQVFLGFEMLALDGAFVQWGGARDDLRPHVTYAVLDRDQETLHARNCAGMVGVTGLLDASHIAPSGFKAELRAAFDLWEKAANIEFVETANATTADIVIGAQAKPEGRAFANVDYKAGDGPVRLIAKSLICLNPQRTWKIGFDGNLDAYDLRFTLAHEIGHAIGLDHPSPSGQLMSYRYEEKFRGLQAGDLQGVAVLYGRRGFWQY